MLASFLFSLVSFLYFLVPCGRKETQEESLKDETKIIEGRIIERCEMDENIELRPKVVLLVFVIHINLFGDPLFVIEMNGKRTPC